MGTSAVRMAKASTGRRPAMRPYKKDDLSGVHSLYKNRVGDKPESNTQGEVREDKGRQGKPQESKLAGIGIVTAITSPSTSPPDYSQYGASHLSRPSHLPL